jgi:tRNA-Thr(GGU) m(6)t(6)A37 methyltransferase TsaA
MTLFQFQAIGMVHSCFKEKFGIPRQPGLVPAATARIELLPPFNRPEALSGLETFSHLWVLFVFHHRRRITWQPRVRPPRLGGNRRLGVFATRSGYRPNPLGMSVVKLNRIKQESDRIELHVAGIDLMDGTPVLDIKPYLPYSDSLPQAEAGFAASAPATHPDVRFSAQAEDYLASLDPAVSDSLRELIIQVLAQDPRPAYLEQGERTFGMHLCDINLRWQVEGETTLVTSMQRAVE